MVNNTLKVIDALGNMIQSTITTNNLISYSLFTVVFCGALLLLIRRMIERR